MALAGTELPAVIAIDGGNSKTDVALVAGDGSILASVRGSGVPRSAGLESTVDMLAELVGTAARMIGHTRFPVAQHLSACLANLDLPDEEVAMMKAMCVRQISHTSDVVNDTFAVLRAGLHGHRGNPERMTGVPAGFWGIGVVCGTGINCAGLDRDGRTARFLALGGFSGDWGGGTHLSTSTLWSAIRAEDGRGPETALSGAVAAHFGMESVRAVALGVHYGEIGAEQRASLVPLLFAVAGDGDAVARGLVIRQAEEVCAMALSAMRRLQLTDCATPVVLGGGVLAARDPLLIERVESGLGRVAPRAWVQICDIPPVSGAALRGLDFIGASPDAERRLRSAYLPAQKL